MKEYLRMAKIFGIGLAKAMGLITVALLAFLTLITIAVVLFVVG